MALEHKHKALTCLYLLTPTPIDNYYQCYDKYDEDDNDITVITSNLKENKCENSGAVTRGITSENLKTLDKDSGGQEVDHVHT